MLQVLIPIAIGGYLLFRNDKNKTLEKKVIIEDQSNGLGRPENMNFYSALFKTMPQEIITYIAKNFDYIYGSPYSTSIYSEPGQTWDYSPKNQIRVSDHWNFFSRDYNDPNSQMKQHSITDKPVKNNSHWTIAKKNNKGFYEVIISLPKKHSKEKLKSEKVDWLALKQKGEILDRQKYKNIQKKIQQEKLKRKKKIEADKLYVSFDRIYSEKQGSKFTTVEEKGLKAILQKETEHFITVKHSKNGYSERYKKTTLRNYKEYLRKPKSFTKF